MTSKEFMETAKGIVADYVDENMNKGQTKIDYEVACVWFGYVLGNMKVLITTDIKDGMYYEVTYNKAKDEIYFDAYKRWENRCYTKEGGRK